MRKINVSILGPGKIANRFIKGNSDYANYYSICGRDVNKAKQFADKYNVAIAYSIEEMLKDENVEAVYIATPNPSHYALCKLCLENGKHVMCEKPFVANKEECNELFDLAENNGLMLMEADKQLFLPLTKKIKEVISSGLIGDVKYMMGNYCDNREGRDVFLEDHWVFENNTGGSIRDIGIYPIAYFNYLNDWKIKNVVSNYRNLYGVDCFTACSIQYENGVFANAVSGFDIDLPKYCEIYGTKGLIHIDNFWKTGNATIHLNNGETIEIEEEMLSDFKYETDHFLKCIIENKTESDIIGRTESLKLIDIFNTVKS